MGLEAGKDTFCTLARISQPADGEAMDAWIASLAESMRVVRVTPSAPNDAPLAATPITTRGTGVHEIAALPHAAVDLEAIREAIIAQYADEYDYEEPAVDIAVPEGMTSYFNDTNSQGDNHDTTYLMTENFTLTSDDDFVVVYGVNHTTTGKAVYRKRAGHILRSGQRQHGSRGLPSLHRARDGRGRILLRDRLRPRHRVPPPRVETRAARRSTAVHAALSSSLRTAGLPPCRAFHVG